MPHAQVGRWLIVSLYKPRGAWELMVVPPLSQRWQPAQPTGPMPSRFARDAQFEKAGAIAQAGMPNLRPVPGFVMTTHDHTARLYIKPPAGASVVDVSAAKRAGNVPGTATLVFEPVLDDDAAAGDEVCFAVVAEGWGRVFAVASFSDGTSSRAQYYVMPSE